MTELDLHLAVLLNPYGDARHRADAERAATWLLDHPEVAHERLLALLDPPGDAAPAAVELLPRFGRAESVPALARVLADGSDHLAWHAGQALARHPDAAAAAALGDALAAPRRETVTAALDGLAARGDAGACAAVLAVAGSHADPAVRAAAERAAAELGCDP
jgi:hypothetical protein